MYSWLIQLTIGQNCMQIVTKNIRIHVTRNTDMDYWIEAPISKKKRTKIPNLPSKMSAEQMHSPSSPCSSLVRMVSLEVMKLKLQRMINYFP